MASTAFDMDSLIRFPNEINGIAPISPSMKKKKRSLKPIGKKTKEKFPKKKIINIDPIDEEEEIVYNAARISDRYDRENLEVRLAREARERGSLVMGNRVQEVRRRNGSSPFIVSRRMTWCFLII